MISHFKKLKKNRGMTYVELIIVMSIFGIMSSIVLFNYGRFQANVDIRNLANDIAMKIVEAQKSALSGNIPPVAQQITLSASPFAKNWKPAYGIYFTKPASNFVFFTDLDNGALRDEPPIFDIYSLANNTTPLICLPGRECLDSINITKGNIISSIDIFFPQDPADSPTASLTNLSITFTRPNSGPVFESDSSKWTMISYAQITITSPSGPSAKIKVYASGRIQIN